MVWMISEGLFGFRCIDECLYDITIGADAWHLKVMSTANTSKALSGTTQ